MSVAESRERVRYEVREGDSESLIEMELRFESPKLISNGNVSQSFNLPIYRS